MIMHHSAHSHGGRFCPRRHSRPVNYVLNNIFNSDLPTNLWFSNFFCPPPPKQKTARKGVADLFWGIPKSKVTCGSEVLIELETLLQIYEAQLGDWRFTTPGKLTAGT